MKKRTLSVSRELGPSEPLANIGIPPVLLGRMASLGVTTVAELSTVSEDQLLALKSVGPLTVARLRRMLQSVGLDFREPADPLRRARWLNAKTRDVPAAERVPELSDASHVAELGTQWETVRRCLQRDITTIGQLRAMTRHRIVHTFSRRVAVDLLSGLQNAGVVIANGPKPRRPAGGRAGVIGA